MPWLGVLVNMVPFQNIFKLSFNFSWKFSRQKKDSVVFSTLRQRECTSLQVEKTKTTKGRHIIIIWLSACVSWWQSREGRTRVGVLLCMCVWMYSYSIFLLHCKDKMPKIWNKYSQKRNIGALFMCLWANYIFPRWVCLFCWRKNQILCVDWSWEYTV